jgi:hypothetical protein
VYKRRKDDTRVPRGYYFLSVTFILVMSSSKSEVPLGPSIATAEHVSALFQTDTAINEARRRRAKKERAFGNPLELPTKILSMVLAPTIEGGEEVLYAYVGGANHSARKVNLKASNMNR